MIFVKRLTTFYALSLLIDIYGELNQNYFLVWIFKPLLMPILLWIFLLNTNDVKHLSLKRTFIIVSLVCSWFGDLFLLYPESNLFLFGLVSFLFGHFCYIGAFCVRFVHEGVERFRRRLTFSSIFVTSIPFVFYIVFVLSMFSPHINVETDGKNRLWIPVILYTLVIVTMSFVSFLRDRQVDGFYLVFIGAILFVMSDSFLALNKFVFPLPTPSLYIMLTYGLGQYLITIGILRGTNNVDCKTFSD